MTQCSDTCRPPTGTRMEHCKVAGCHQTFSGNTLGSAHRVDAGSYVLAAPTLTGKPQRFPTEQDVPKGWKLSSVGNQLRRCLEPGEMEARGWRLVKDVWHGPQLEGDSWWSKEDSEAETVSENEPELDFVSENDPEEGPLDNTELEPIRSSVSVVDTADDDDFSWLFEDAL